MLCRTRPHSATLGRTRPNSTTASPANDNWRKCVEAKLGHALGGLGVAFRPQVGRVGHEVRCWSTLARYWPNVTPVLPSAIPSTTPARPPAAMLSTSDVSSCRPTAASATSVLSSPKEYPNKGVCSPPGMATWRQKVLQRQRRGNNVCAARAGAPAGRSQGCDDGGRPASPIAVHPQRHTSYKEGNTKAQDSTHKRHASTAWQTKAAGGGGPPGRGPQGNPTGRCVQPSTPANELAGRNKNTNPTNRRRGAPTLHRHTSPDYKSDEILP